MKTIESFDEYKTLIRDFRKEYRRPFSNIYYMPSDIERYIRLKRLEYEKTECGLVFFFDEETYYKVCLYVKTNEAFSIPIRDKMLYIRNVFVGKDAELFAVEQRLLELGFAKASSTVEIKGDVQKLWEGCSRIKKHIDFFEKYGYVCVAAEPDMYDEIEKLVLDSGIIKKYHMNYRAKEEKAELTKGSYLCVLDKERKLCGANIGFIHGEAGEGVAIAIKEEYKMKGLAPILTYYRYKWLKEHDVKFVVGWIVTTNIPSIRYHMSLGYELTAKYANEWVLECN